MPRTISIQITDEAFNRLLELDRAYATLNTKDASGFDKAAAHQLVSRVGALLCDPLLCELAAAAAQIDEACEM